MPYTVKQLAKLSGVSVRTLHYYDEIELLKPAYYGDNNYRYYEEEQLLLLQQILFYRELGFPLDGIREILQGEQFDKIEALESHKNLLQGDLDRTHKLIKTIDKTIKHLRGTKMIKLDDIFEGFTDEKQQAYENFLVKNGVDRDVINKSKQKVKHWSKEQWLENKRENDALYAALAEAIDNKQTPDASSVQVLIKKHYELTKIFWTPTKETYVALGQMYYSDPEFVRFFDNVHPKLLDFLTAAMKIFAENKLA
ncbi:MAG: MerR family transcriptional regulator [Gammaproteobacteria bacterium]|nr:MerR family transcriptional regulator [Gammaproteobacteria bacterium]